MTNQEMEKIDKIKYMKEPMDMRLFCIRFLKKIGLVFICSVLGAAISVSIFVAMNVLGPMRQYQAQSMYFIEFATDPRLNDAYSYYNDYTWNVWIQSDEFVQRIQSELDFTITDEELRKLLFADLPADLRMPVSIITTSSKQRTMDIVDAVEKTFLELPKFQKEVGAVRIIDSPDEAHLVTGEEDILRVVLLSFFTVFILCSFLLSIYLVSDSSIFLPITFEKRYQIPMLGTLNSVDFLSNFVRFFSESKEVVLTSVIGETDLLTIKQEMIHKLKDSKISSSIQFICIPSVLQCPEGISYLREKKGVLLVVEAGKRNSKQIEYTLDFFKKQGVVVQAALFWQADEKLIKYYYLGTKKEF